MGFFDNLRPRLVKPPTKPTADPNNPNPKDPNNPDPNDPKNKKPTNDPGIKNPELKPFEIYAKMFESEDPNDPNNKPAPKFNLDPAKIKEASGKINFLEGLPEELSAKLKEGNPDIETILAVVNHAGATAYARAMEHGTSLTGSFMDIRSNYEKQGLDKHVRSILARTRATSAPNVSKNPIVKEFVGMIADKLYANFPDATDEWVAEQSQNFFLDVAKEINPDAFGTEEEEGVDEDGFPITRKRRTSKGIMDQEGFEWENYLSSRRPKKAATS